MSEPTLGPPMDPANPLLRVDLMLTHVLDDAGFHVEDRSNVTLGMDWNRAFSAFVKDDQSRILPPGEYVFTICHGTGFRVSELPAQGLSEQTRQALVEGIQAVCEEAFRDLCVGLVTFPTQREIRVAARALLFASLHASLRSQKDPTALQPDFLTLTAAVVDELSVRREVKEEGIVSLLIQEGGVPLPGGIRCLPGLPDVSGRVEVKVGYLRSNPMYEALNAALVARLNEGIDLVRDEVLRVVLVQYDDNRTWYEKGVAHLRKLIDR